MKVKLEGGDTRAKISVQTIKVVLTTKLRLKNNHMATYYTFASKFDHRGSKMVISQCTGGVFIRNQRVCFLSKSFSNLVILTQQTHKVARKFSKC